MRRRLGQWLTRAAEAETRSGPLDRLLVMLGLSGFAMAQPLLGLLGEEPTWFTFRGASGSEIVLFALIVAFGVPLVLWALGMLVRLVHPMVGWWFHLGVVALLTGLTVLQWVKQVVVPPPAVLLGLATVAGLGFAAAYVRFAAVSLWTRFTAVLPVMAAGSFLLMAPTSGLVTASAAGPGTATVDGGEPPSLVVLMLDELPTQSLLDDDGGIDRVRFPNLAELADDGTWYPAYSSTAPTTRFAVPSILSGLEPTVSPPIYTSHPDNLFSLLAPTHDLRVLETATSLCPPGACPEVGASNGQSSTLGRLVGDAADVWLDRTSLGAPPESLLDDFAVQVVAPSGAGADVPIGDRSRLLARPQQQADFLSTIEPVSRPTLWFLHLMLPHQPWYFYPDGGEYSADGVPVDALNQEGAWFATLTEQRHLLQLQYADALVGEVLDALRAADEYDDSVVVVTADHGVSFVLDTPRREPVADNVDRLAYVPLIIKGAGQDAGTVDPSNVVSHDLLPTLASLVGVEVSWEVDGHPIGSSEQRDRGPMKEFFDFGSGPTPELRGVIEFDHRERAPTSRTRWVSLIDADEGPTDALLDAAGAGDVAGRSLDELAVGTIDVRHRLAARDALRDPSTVDVPPGVVGIALTGDLDRDDSVLLEVNGRVVAAAPLVLNANGSSATYLLLPPGALEQDGNEIAVGLLRDGEVLRVP